MHLVGFITKKFVTMHGHMNVKLEDIACDFLFLFFFIFIFFFTKSYIWLDLMGAMWGNLAALCA
jgi:hypothetical protein